MDPPSLNSVHPEVVDWGSDQGRTVLSTAGAGALRRELAERENAGPARKIPFLERH
jgi:hypothetical protein